MNRTRKVGRAGGGGAVGGGGLYKTFGGAAGILVLVAAILLVFNAHTVYKQYTVGGSGVGVVVAPSSSSTLLPPTTEQATTKEKQESMKEKEEEEEDRVCQHGGYSLAGKACICGKGTRGRFCESIDPTYQVDSMLGQYGLCAPRCLPITVWYPTPDFKFRNFTMDDGSYKEMLQDLIVWRDGGDIRGDVGATSVTSMIDRDFMDVVKSLGPWSKVDKHMIQAIIDFRHDHRSGRVRSIAPDGSPILSKAGAELVREWQKRQEQQQQQQQQGDGSGGSPPPVRPPVRIVHGLMLHNNLPRFQALWQVLFHPDHYYVIHIDPVENHWEAEGLQEDPKAMREGVMKIIQETQCCSGGSREAARGTIWDRVVVLPEKDCVDALWGDITLVYIEVLLWLAVLRQNHWEWDYFVNLSGSDIPAMNHADMTNFLASFTPKSFVYTHENAEQFRQTYMLPSKSDKDVLIVFSGLSKDFAPGKYRERVGITRLYGCSQWHVMHRGLLTRLVSRPEVLGLLFSYKHSAIPDESFFSTASAWLAKQYPNEIIVERGDLRYWNEGPNRHLEAFGELWAIMERARKKEILFARKSGTAIITCTYTNRMLGLHNDCSEFNSTGRYPPDAIPSTPPIRPDNMTFDVVMVELEKQDQLWKETNGIPRVRL